MMIEWTPEEPYNDARYPASEHQACIKYQPSAKNLSRQDTYGTAVI
jgi:hypothetical protein